LDDAEFQRLIRAEVGGDPVLLNRYEKDTRTDSYVFDSSAPTVSNLSLKETDNELSLTFEADESIEPDGAIRVRFDGPGPGEGYTFDESDFDEEENGDEYSYALDTDHSPVEKTGRYTAVIEVAGARGESDSYVFGSEPTIHNVVLGTDGDGHLALSFETGAQLHSISVRVDGPDGDTAYSFDDSDFEKTEKDDEGTYTYTLESTRDYTGDGQYSAWIEEAVDSDGTNGANGESDRYEYGSSPSVFDVRLENDGSDNLAFRFKTHEPLGTDPSDLRVSIETTEGEEGVAA